jgi:hypothetical protein
MGARPERMSRAQLEQLWTGLCDRAAIAHRRLADATKLGVGDDNARNVLDLQRALDRSESQLRDVEALLSASAIERRRQHRKRPRNVRRRE